jgi:osmotically-inducible protein OsmY
MDRRRTRGETEGRDVGRGYSGAPGYGQGFGRDFGGAQNSGADGSWGLGYGGSLGASDYRAGGGGEAYGGGFTGGDYERSFGGRGGGFGPSRDEAEDVYQASYGGAGEARAFDRDAQEGPHRGRGPAGWTMSDTRIREELCERLTDDRWLDATDLEVLVADGEVTLTGHVDSRDDALYAEAIAMRVPGVKRVNNRIGEPGHADDDRLGEDAAERARPDWKILPP